MVAGNFIEDQIKEVLDSANRNYRDAHQLAERGIVSERLGGYLKSLVHIQSCMSIARLYAKQKERDETINRFWEANLVLREINYVYSTGAESELRIPLIQLAVNEIDEAESDCNNLLGVAV